jgi:ferric-dicitrate binding protein FerR (iron transport regulator)
VVHLDVGSEISVLIGDRKREITLTRGARLFRRSPRIATGHSS